jgi:hypothetical protein
MPACRLFSAAKWQYRQGHDPGKRAAERQDGRGGDSGEQVELDQRRQRDDVRDVGPQGDERAEPGEERHRVPLRAPAVDHRRHEAGERIAAAVAMGAIWLWTREGLLILLGIVAVLRCSERHRPKGTGKRPSGISSC